MVLLCVVVVVVVLVVSYGYFKINQQIQDLTKKQLLSFKTVLLFREPLKSLKAGVLNLRQHFLRLNTPHGFVNSPVDYIIYVYIYILVYSPGVVPLA